MLMRLRLSSSEAGSSSPEIGTRVPRMAPMLKHIYMGRLGLANGLRTQELSSSASVPSEVAPLEVSPSAPQLRVRVWFSFDYFGVGLYLTTRELWSWSALLSPRVIVVLVCPFVTTCYDTSVTNTDATDSRPEPSFDRPANSEVPFRPRVLISQVSSKE
ncbi:hypothetical protein Tco_0046323 [Tanacetum coccineum]